MKNLLIIYFSIALWQQVFGLGSSPYRLASCFSQFVIGVLVRIFVVLWFLQVVKYARGVGYVLEECVDLLSCLLYELTEFSTQKKKNFSLKSMKMKTTNNEKNRIVLH